MMHRNAIYVLLACVLVLTTLGIVMLFSTSAFAQDSRGDMFYFIKRQALWLIAGGIVCVAVALTNYHWWRQTWWIWFAASVILLILCYVPPIGMKINGSWRWINLGIASFQPSELAKIAAILFLAWWFSKIEHEAGSFIKGFVIPIGAISPLLGLIFFEHDMGSTALIGGVMFALMFAAGTHIKYLAPIALSGIAAIIYVATQMEERAGRILAFLHPEKYKLGDGLQQWQALIALGSGGIDGLGLGEGRQKMLYLPYAHTDFIFPMIGEELGLKFTLLTVFCYVLICFCGALVASNAKDKFGMILGFGAVLLITFQAIVNIGVTTSLLPNKGMPLPFISYGGSNLLICLFLVGLLINIHLQGKPIHIEKNTSLLRTRTSVRL